MSNKCGINPCYWEHDDDEKEEISSTARAVINSIALVCNEISHTKGWYDEPRTFGDIIALGHSEFSEAFEAFRKDHELKAYQDIHTDKFEGAAVELVDVVIRCFDTLIEAGFDVGQILNHVMAFNRTRPYRHGGKAL